MNFVRWDETVLPLEELCGLWNEEIGGDFPITERLFRQNSLNCPFVLSEGSWYVMEGNNVIGFIITKFTKDNEDHLPSNIGWIQALLVKDDSRNNGIGNQLLIKAEQALASVGVTKIILGRDFHHYFPGIPSTVSNIHLWFENRGYVEVNKVKDFYRVAPDHAEEIDTTEITMSELEPSEKMQFLSFMEESFPGRWEYEAREYFKKGGDGSHFIVAKYGEEIIGFVRVNGLDSPVIGPNIYWHYLFEEKVGGIGPLGIKKSHRKKGYGKAIVQKAINIAVERGCRHLIIDWTELDEFYQSFGFKAWKEYEQYEKSMRKI
ncbi:GNAT family N-acetyltransferase [Bacillus sp. Marseille-Q3570]|uniref:GNAT family N-acetyltransferase n=1 Tax=Bacillus sp. Marseille-Q3570 TaxID=2963522 RepID=UPI0021B82049|nr:GNAT family N-acetyltransferase [Bacillus sp. Marseille-Q3570]